jgi:hypothetical protein
VIIETDLAVVPRSESGRRSKGTAVPEGRERKKRLSGLGVRFEGKVNDFAESSKMGNCAA